jgi:probable HAF family extracellular repeat protein
MASHGLDVSDSGQFVVGVATTAGGQEHAFRWKASTGMIDLGTLGGSSSAGWAVNGNGSVVVGQSDTAAENPNAQLTHAFRWTASGGMTDLGTLGGSNSVAYDVNDNGRVVVGIAATGNAGHAFRWTAAGMFDLGTLGGTNSQANAVNANGSVVVGMSDPASGGNHAFRWTSGDGMSDLGTLSGGFNSEASDVSENGSVIVGWSGTGGPNGPGTGAARAFRWTAATGMQNLNSLLSNAGVNMAGITLTYANAVSSKGEFIVGRADFPGAPNHAFLVRYADGKQQNGPVIAGVTTPGSVQSSIDDLGHARQQAMMLRHALVAPVLGTMDSHQQREFAEGLFLLANATFSENSSQLTGDDGVRAALAIRYLPKGLAGFRPLAEIGGWTEQNAAFRFQREYANGAGLALGEGFTGGSVSNTYARAGVVWEATTNDQVSFTGELGRDWSNVGAYAEQVSPTNPFEAYISPGTDVMNSARLRLEGSHRFGPHFDVTLWAAAARSFDDAIELSVAVPAVGANLAPAGVTSATWAEYGGRVGFKLSPQLTADFFVAGVSGLEGIGTSAELRAAARLTF